MVRVVLDIDHLKPSPRRELRKDGVVDMDGPQSAPPRPPLLAALFLPPLQVYFQLMRKAADYRKHAEKCRDLANRMESQEHRAQLLEMARHWDRMERERVEFIGSYPEFAIEPEGHSDDEPKPFMT